MRGQPQPRTPCDGCADEFRRAHEKRTATDEVAEQIAVESPSPAGTQTADAR
jgi:hypothetical protein